MAPLRAEARHHAKFRRRALRVVRARRRAAELPGIDVAAVAAQIRERDERDRSRADSPLVAAADAVHLDTTGLDIGQVESRILEIARQRISSEGKSLNV